MMNLKNIETELQNFKNGERGGNPVIARYPGGGGGWIAVRTRLSALS